jgi:hypothetical protein
MKTWFLVSALACAATPVQGQDQAWKADVLLESDHGLGGTAVGDLDPDSPGNEVVTVNSVGEAWMVQRASSGWRPTCIHKGPGELIMCAIGDVDPRHPGQEFVGVGMVEGTESSTGPGQVLVIHREPDGWVATRVFEDDHMLHGVAIGDVSARSPGNEIIACGFSHRVTLLRFDQGSWRPETIYVGNDRMKIVAVADVLPDRDGLEVLACGSDGNVVVLWEGKLGWQHQVVFSDPIGQSRVAAGDLGVLIGGDLGKVTLATRRDRQWEHEFITRDTGKMRGVAIADIDDDVPGSELYACGYSRNVTQLTRDEQGFWRSRIVFTAEKSLHHLVAGDVDPTHPGDELVTCGHGGRLIVLYPHE